MTDKLLAEWFWIDRWDGSRAAGLPLEPRGLYREMLTRAWRLGGYLPSDHAEIQRLCRVTAKEWRRCWPLVERFWRMDGDDRIVNETQLEVMADARRRKDTSEERAKHAASTRWRHAQARAHALPEQSPPSPSPSPLTDNNAPSSNARARAGDCQARHRASPLVEGRRQEMRSEIFALVTKISQRTGRDPVEVMAKGKTYRDDTPRGGFDPAAWSDDRVANTLLDLRETWKNLEARAKAAAPQEPPR